ncbi:glycosyltransferase involved in cell wall biosynthesis [Ulvibacter sp. MAR_2010_11]|uniref:glycosyltransferase family 2 protein n=1 Tax=Ulvibacter sp. MAR_2010_11 TaxID=1250229 RepID=UPI000C2B84D0|nr:glycosyltransferase family 2 protein [Ulvibacter sp. MAR_2010_11]PKA82125.1 glycosyltransferase involved in cell wall biosynthesis [Ulvibacter sp. MAR_2010_11]
MPKLSIITVNFNNAEGLNRTIQSVAEQDFSDLEYIVVDGNSSDDSVAIIKKHESVVSQWISEPDTGVYHAMNKGIGMATGDYLLFLNSGDHFYKVGVLSKIEKYLTAEDLLLFDIHVTGQGKDFIKKHPDSLRFSYLFEETFAHQAVIIKRSLFESVGLYDESYTIVSDWKFFIHAVKQGASYKTIHEVLTTYYLDGMSATAEGTFKRRAERETILTTEFPQFYEDYKERELLKMNRFKALAELEKSKAGRKITSGVLRLLLRIFRNKSVKDL